MTNTKKQVKITKLLRKGAGTRLPEDYEDILKEVAQLQQKLKEKQDELFQVQRNNYRQKACTIKKKKTEFFVRPQKLILSNSVESLKRSLELMAMLSGVEVKSYVVDDHCCVVYHMQSHTQLDVKHGLRIEMKTVSGDHEVSKSSLPVGFNLKAVMEGYRNVMMPECLGAIRKALVAYYDRLHQFEKLKKLLNIEAQLFKLLDGSHIEVSFYIQRETEEEEEEFNITLVLDYRVYDIRPKVYSFKDTDLPEEATDALKQQCIVFKNKPLHKAFKDAFMSGIGAYKLVRQANVMTLLLQRVNSPLLNTCHPTVEEATSKLHLAALVRVGGEVGESGEQRARPRRRPRARDPRHDDTFRPEDCSDQGEDAMDE